jgi:hypothetical protein
MCKMEVNQRGLNMVLLSDDITSYPLAPYFRLVLSTPSGIFLGY